MPYKMRNTPEVVNQIWNDNELKEMKSKMCRKERILRKYQVQHQWKAFCEDHKYYFKQLYMKKEKKHYIKSEIHKSRNKNRELYILV